MATRGLNKLQLIGNLGQAPVLRYFPDGTPTVTLSVGVSDKWKDRNGNEQEHTEWTYVVLRGQMADNAAKYLTKGSKVYVEGPKHTRDYKDKDGVVHYVVELMVTNIQYLSPAKNAAPAASAAPASAPAASGPSGMPNYGAIPPMDEMPGWMEDQ